MSDSLEHAKSTNGAPVAVVEFHFDPQKGVRVERNGGFPRHKLLWAMETEKASVLALDPPQKRSTEEASVVFIFHATHGLQVKRHGYFPEDMLLMALSMEIHVNLSQTIAQSMMQQAMQQRSQVLLPDGSPAPPGLLGGGA
jgi:hypothetical protein